MSWLGLEGRVAWVTGAAAGIGRACSEALARQGAHVVVGDVNREAGEQAAEALNAAQGGRALFVELDVTRKASVDAALKAARERFGTVDILVNNAGILIPRLLVDPAGREELTEDIWDRVVSVNQKGCFLCAQAVARELLRRKQKGVLINMTSESGLEGSEGQSVYAATKGAMYSLTRSWAKELGKHGIRVVGVAPGIVEATALRTPEYERAVAYTRGITVEAFRSAYEHISIPLGRVGRLSEVADVVCFLASDRAAYLHGTTVNVSGGKSRA